MSKTCRICGKPITGKAKYCSECQRQKKREYNRSLYNNNEDYRQKKINSAKKKQQKKNKLGSLYRYSEHSQKDFKKEHQVVQNMKKKAFSGKANGRKTSVNNEESYNVEAYARYNEAVGYEEQKLDTFRKCPICGGTVFQRERGMIVCMTCGICEDIFCMTAYGFDEWTAKDFDNDFIQALRKLGDKHGGCE